MSLSLTGILQVVAVLVVGVAVYWYRHSGAKAPPKPEGMFPTEFKNDTMLEVSSVVACGLEEGGFVWTPSLFRKQSGFVDFEPRPSSTTGPGYAPPTQALRPGSARFTLSGHGPRPGSVSPGMLSTTGFSPAPPFTYSDQVFTSYMSGSGPQGGASIERPQSFPMELSQTEAPHGSHPEDNFCLDDELFLHKTPMGQGYAVSARYPTFEVPSGGAGLWYGSTNEAVPYHPNPLSHTTNSHPSMGAFPLTEQASPLLDGFLLSPTGFGAMGPLPVEAPSVTFEGTKRPMHIESEASTHPSGNSSPASVEYTVASSATSVSAPSTPHTDKGNSHKTDPARIPKGGASAEKADNSSDEFSEGSGEIYSCTLCLAEFRVRGYLTRHMKKHSTTKAYTCPFFGLATEGKCHSHGGFSRRDTYKTHLKSRHYLYPPGTKSGSRGEVSGCCGLCGKAYQDNELWVELHIETGECPGLPDGFVGKLRLVQRMIRSEKLMLKKARKEKREEERMKSALGMVHEPTFTVDVLSYGNDSQPQSSATRQSPAAQPLVAQPLVAQPFNVCT